MKTQLRKAKREELREIAEIYAREFSKPPYNESWTRRKAEKKVKYFFDNYDLYAIRFDGQLAGFITLNTNFMCPGDVAFGEEFAIKKELQGRNIGKIVLKELFEIYRKKGFKRIIGIANTSSRALSLYEALGFKISKDEVIVEKELK